MERKIVKVGNSLGVIIPSAFLEELGVSHQDIIQMEYDKELKTITIRNKETTLDSNHLEKVIKSVVDNYLKEKGL
ncbi:AbrB/MazE/SpoVT family DNA-binding domain-containing protein [Peribacillus asahii]|uniref:AbrB/MazE/SpoVT family DNA-binding domain-containing protein n=1 Tax=Peribacillus asahii TaxID=228899 RepID=UPI0038120733